MARRLSCVVEHSILSSIRLLHIAIIGIFLSECVDCTLEHAVCAKNFNCDKWILQTSWTQGGYEAICSKSNEKRELVFRIFVIRNLYRCADKLAAATKIVNSYFDGAGKLCHLLEGDKICPGLSNAANCRDKNLQLKLFCGQYLCRTKYHRCEFCPLAPWYSWLPPSAPIFKKSSIACKHQCQTSIGRKSGNKCVRCDGKIVDRTFCESNATEKYFVDIPNSKPSWNEWKRTSGCMITSFNNSSCGNHAFQGKMVWTRQCQYPKNPVQLNPRFCGSSKHIATSRCNVTAPPCTSTKNILSASSKASHVWIAVILAGIIILVFLLLWLLAKCKQIRSSEGGSYSTIATGLFSSCATQTSPRYSPRRIISEPEYALIGNWRQNVVHCPQLDGKYSSGDNVYWGIEFQYLSDDNITDSEEDVIASQDSARITNKETRECCELNAESKRALDAKVQKRKTR